MAENLRKTAQAGRGHSKARLRLDTQPAKDRIVELVQQGVTISSALDNVGYARKTYEEWRRKDKVFAAKMDQARQLRAPDREVKRGERLGFAEWRAKYLNITTPWHQLQWVDLLEGREPRDLHPSQTYEPGKRGRLLVNCPPFHGKSICLTVDYVVYRLCLDPSYRVLIISAGAELAKDFVFAIKQRLTSPEFMDLQKAYAPDGGWEATAETWADGKITFGTSVRESSESSSHEKDANVLALGMRSKVYGRRADLVIVDDGVDSTNVAEHAKQMRWLRQMVETRIESGGRLLVVGTRVAPVDLYSELRKPENYANGKVPWTYLASPAILEESENPAEHKTLWPYADSPWVSAEDVGTDECICENTAECSAGVVIDGVQRFPRWDGVHLENGPRASNNNTDWALIFQQKSVAEDATFPEHAVTAATNGMRHPGPLKRDVMGHPYSGMHGKYVIAGLDPSIKGFAGLLVIALDPESGKRYLLNAFNLKAPTSEQLEAKMKELTETYGVHEWRVEKTGNLMFFTQRQDLRAWFSTRGVRFTEHYTSKNKWDASFGISSMASLFGEYDKAPGLEGWREINPPLIEFPRAASSDGLKALTHQLVTWNPDADPNKVPCDMVMALWFAEIGCRERLNSGSLSNVVSIGRSSRFISPRAFRKNSSVSLSDYRSSGY